jgi:hypothetical protein
MLQLSLEAHADPMVFLEEHLCLTPGESSLCYLFVQKRSSFFISSVDLINTKPHLR